MNIYIITGIASGTSAISLTRAASKRRLEANEGWGSTAAMP